MGVTCDWRPEYDAENRPMGPICGAPATHRIVWLDGTGRYSYGCGDHLELASDATPHRIEKLDR